MLSIGVCDLSRVFHCPKAGYQLFLLSTSNLAKSCASYDEDFNCLLPNMLDNVNIGMVQNVPYQHH